MSDGLVSDGLWLVVGLGNPGPSHANNRHNVGFMVADVLAGRAGGRFAAHRSRVAVLEGRLEVGGPRVVLGKPRVYMNDSGGPVKSLLDYFKVGLDRLVVLHDELDLPYGTLRVKFGGGDNGHNGLRSVRGALGSGEFYRLRFGIGRPPGRMDPALYLLRDFSPTDRKDLGLHVDRAADAVTCLVTDGLARAQNAYNT